MLYIHTKPLLLILLDANEMIVWIQQLLHDIDVIVHACMFVYNKLQASRKQFHLEASSCACSLTSISG